ncbi:MAG: prepilin-type N-terminal cleavage/methylation domain-containing protein [bacterium]
MAKIHFSWSDVVTRQGRILITHDKNGFTLTEIIVIIIVIGLLVAAAIPTYVSLTKAAEQGNVESVIGSLSSALNLYSANQIVNNQPITVHNPFDDLAVKPPNYAGAFPDVDLSNCPAGDWAFQSGDPGLNGNWAVVCYRPNATLTQTFTWGGVQWIILVVNTATDQNGTPIGLSLDDYQSYQW